MDGGINVVESMDKIKQSGGMLKRSLISEWKVRMKERLYSPQMLDRQ